MKTIEEPRPVILPTDENRFDPPWQIMRGDSRAKDSRWLVCDQWGNQIAAVPTIELARLIFMAPHMRDMLHAAIEAIGGDPATELRSMQFADDVRELLDAIENGDDE